jgi:chromosome segregation ATPase
VRRLQGSETEVKGQLAEKLRQLENAHNDLKHSQKEFASEQAHSTELAGSLRANKEKQREMQLKMDQLAETWMHKLEEQAREQKREVQGVRQECADKDQDNARLQGTIDSLNKDVAEYKDSLIKQRALQDKTEQRVDFATKQVHKINRISTAFRSKIVSTVTKNLRYAWQRVCVCVFL